MNPIQVKVYFAFAEYVEVEFATLPRPGDCIVLPKQGACTVKKVEHYPSAPLEKPETHLYVVKDWTA